MIDERFYPDTVSSMNTAPEAGDPSGKKTPVLKDYFCPFCGHKLFRGNVNEFNMVCQECNRLVNSKTIPEPTPEKE